MVEGFITLLDGLYARLLQKRAAYGHDPVQRLRVLGQRLGALDEAEFHRAMFEIGTALRDGHTRYIGPEHVAGEVAFLPMLVDRGVAGHLVRSDRRTWLRHRSGRDRPMKVHRSS